MRIGIIGLGRFGQLLKSILSRDPHHQLITYDIKQTGSLREVTQCDTLFIAVPIRAFAETIDNITPLLTQPTTVIDVCSVKVYPAAIMQDKLPSHVDIIASHPLFGPDSIQTDQQPRFMLHAIRDSHQRFHYWWDFFANQQFQMLDITPDEHDRYAARSQGITHVLGRTLNQMHIQATPIDTLGFERLRAIINQTCNDSLELYHDLQRYNPYTEETLAEFKIALDKTTKAL